MADPLQGGLRHNDWTNFVRYNLAVHEVDWKIVASLLGGGAVGAIITAVVTTFRGRRQPIGYRIDTIPVFQSTLGSSAFKAVLTVDDNNTKSEFTNLYLAEIQLVNRGNKDYAKFAFGFTLEDGDRAVFVDVSTNDRFHKTTFTAQPTPSAPSAIIDAVLEPFNRGDAYSFKLYVVVPDGRDAPARIEPGSQEAVVFTPMPTLTEIATEVGRGVSLRIMGVRITFFD